MAPAPATPEPQAAGVAVPAADSAGGMPVVDLATLLAESDATEREPSVLPFGVLWSPDVPQEGSAFGVRVLQPAGGRQPESVEGTFVDLPVRFARLQGAWLGIAAVPIGTMGKQELSLRFLFSDGTAREQRLWITVDGRQWSSSNLRVAPRYSSPPPEVLERIQRERRQIRSVLDTATSDWLLDAPFQPPRPLDVTSEFGQERLFNGELQSRHTGLDLRGQEGEPAFAAGRGMVALAGDFYYSGKGVFIDHGLGVYTGYFHLSKIVVEEGQPVEPGQLVGEVGSTGRVTGPHLHWSLWVAGKSLDAGSLLRIGFP